MITIDKMLGRDTVHYADISNMVNSSTNIDSLPDVLAHVVVDSSAQKQIVISDTSKASAEELAKSIQVCPGSLPFPRIAGLLRLPP